MCYIGGKTITIKLQLYLVWQLRCEYTLKNVIDTIGQAFYWSRLAVCWTNTTVYSVSN